MQLYVCGFLFSPDRSRVLLIRKNRPAWQAGKLNGVGGKIEAGESPLDAMIREFREEAQLRIESWQEILVLSGHEDAGKKSDWQGHFFRAFGSIDEAVAVTDEALEIHPVNSLPRDTIPNLRWIIPMLLDDEVLTRLYDVKVMPGQSRVRRFDFLHVCFELNESSYWQSPRDS
jgi:8-oxo-dGTP diphosphatase